MEREMDPGPAELRHAMRGAFNAMKLCLSAFEMPLDASEKLEFLADIERSARRIVSLLDKYESVDSSSGAAPAASDETDELPVTAAAVHHVR